MKQAMHHAPMERVILIWNGMCTFKMRTESWLLKIYSAAFILQMFRMFTVKQV